MPRSVANLALLTAGAIWGMGFVAQQTAMDDIGPMLFLALRFLVAGLVVLPFAAAELNRDYKSLRIQQFAKLARDPRPIVVLGLVFFLGMATQQLGLLTTSVTNTGFLTALYVVLVPIIMIAVLRVRQPIAIWPAMLLTISGIYCLSEGGPSALNIGDLLVLLCALFWACHIILTGRLAQLTGRPITMACCQFLITSAFAFIAFVLLICFDVGEAIPSLNQLSAATCEILYSGVFAGGIAFTLQAVGQRYTNESSAAVLLSTESLFAAFFGALFLDERMQPLGYVGCTMILVAILVVELSPNEASIRH